MNPAEHNLEFCLGFSNKGAKIICAVAITGTGEIIYSNTPMAKVDEVIEGIELLLNSLKEKQISG